MKVHIAPKFRGRDKGDGGIRRVIEAQIEHLPAFDVHPVEDPAQADVLALHAGQLVQTGAPIVAHNHGLYWTAEEEWPLWAWRLNFDVLEVLKRADAVTCPSEWVAQSLRRGMLLEPVVVPHGIDTAAWRPPAKPGPYVLWNKTREDPVCDPGPVQRLAELAPDVPFISTFGKRGGNLQVIGRVPFDEMVNWVTGAAIYLATPRETFGIGTLEAMSCAVPVLGWRWGGQVDLVEHEVTGYLAEPGDYQELAHGLYWCLANRTRLGEAAREAAGRWTWERAAKSYATVYRWAVEDHAQRRSGPRTTVVIPCYEQADTLAEAVESVMAQSDPDVRALIVDDCSPDDTAVIAASLVAKHAGRVKCVRPPQNLYLSGARNFGIEHAVDSRFILPLDADDMLAPNAVQVMADTLDADRGLHIAYGGMEVLEPDGRRWTSDWPPREGFSWALQMSRRNQLPYSAMFRREVWERTGGYRTRVRTAEDADFWCRATSHGFVARKVTQAPMLVKREHEGSMGRVEPEPAWEQWFGWAPRTGMQAFDAPFGSTGTPPEGQVSWPVQSHERPQVSVIIPVGPGHESKVAEALDSLVAQTFVHWEAIVVDDTGGEGHGPELAGFPWVRVLRTDGGAPTFKPVGVATARNMGIDAARGETVVFLDADDFLQPDFLAECIGAYRVCEEVTYTDWIADRGDGKPEVYRISAGSPDDVMQKQYHAVTALYPREALLQAGGFDPKLARGWEDWDLHIALRALGWCGQHVARPLLTYRMHAGSLREAAFANKDELRAKILAKWGRYYEGGERLMPCRGCGGNRTGAPAAAHGYSGTPHYGQATGSGATGEPVLVEYTGQNVGTFLMRGRVTGASYKFGLDGHHTRRYVDPADVPALVERGEYRVVDLPAGTGLNDEQPLEVHDRGTPAPVASEEAPPAASEPVPAPTPEPVATAETVSPGTPSAPQPETNGAVEPQDTPVGMRPSDMTAAQIDSLIPNLGSRALQVMLAHEVADKNRKTVVQSIERALKVA